MSQQFHEHSAQTESADLGAEQTPAPNPAPAAPAAQRSMETSGLDDLLADIDAVLETNAEDFVHGFVQKGGQ